MNFTKKWELPGTNEERAAALGLKPAPTLQGYFWKREEIEGVVSHNKSFEENPDGTKPRLLGMFLDMTPSCNLNCWFCYSSREPLDKGEAPKDALTLQEIEHCIETGKEFGVQTIALAGRGEPTLDRNFLHIVRQATNNCMRTVVFTNNMSITQDTAAELFASETTVIAKLGSLNPESQDRIVGKRGAHVDIYSGLENLINAGFASPRLGVDATITRTSIPELRDVFVYCRQNNIVPYFEALIGRGNALLNRQRLAAEIPSSNELVSFFEGLRRIDEAEFGYTWAITAGMHSLAYEDCRKNLTTISIREDGEVNTCVNERDTHIGNIRKESLRDIIIGSPYLKKLRRLGSPCCSATCGAG